MKKVKVLIEKDVSKYESLIQKFIESKKIIHISHSVAVLGEQLDITWYSCLVIYEDAKIENPFE